MHNHINCHISHFIYAYRRKVITVSLDDSQWESRVWENARHWPVLLCRCLSMRKKCRHRLFANLWSAWGSSRVIDVVSLVPIYFLPRALRARSSASYIISPDYRNFVFVEISAPVNKSKIHRRANVRAARDIIPVDDSSNNFIIPSWLRTQLGDLTFTTFPIGIRVMKLRRNDYTAKKSGGSSVRNK